MREREGGRDIVQEDLSGLSNCFFLIEECEKVRHKKGEEGAEERSHTIE